MKKIVNPFFVVLIFLIVSCSTEPQPINYGSDACDFCRMTISDKRFGCEFVTKKGKVYKFDSIECMIQYINANHFMQDQLARVLVSDYSNSDHFMEASSAIYLESENLKSPMVKGLAAFEKKNELEKIKQQFGGQDNSWDELLKKIK